MSKMRQTRQTLFLHIAAFALLFFCPGLVSAVGSYKYCCDIQKCKNVTSICLDNPACKSACAADLSCASLDQLAVKNYSCFQSQLRDTKYTALGIICNQTYNPLQPPAPPFFIDYATCNRDCAGWRLASSDLLNSWAAPMLQYILPVIIFSMTIPRRQKWEVSDWWFNFELNRIEGIFLAVVSLFWAGIVVIADMTVWVFVIFLGAGPMLVGGIHEAVLDYAVVQHLEDTQKVPMQEHIEDGRVVRQDYSFLHLSEEDKVELMLAILSGNLDLTVGDPQNILRGVIGLPRAAPYVPGRRRSRFLRKFSNTPKEAPVRSPETLLPTTPPKAAEASLPNLGLATINNHRNNGTDEIIQIADTALKQVASARTLSMADSEIEYDLQAFRESRVRLDTAEMRLKSMLQSQYSFGSIVGAPVLFYIGAFIYTLVGLSANKGDNSSAHALAFGMWWMGIVHVAIVSGCLLASNNPSTVTAVVAEYLVRQDPTQRQSAEHHKSARTFLRMSPVYHSQFMPVPLWDRGRMKKMWIKQTNAYHQDWFRNRIKIHLGWILIPAAAFFLILIPSLLAFLVSYFTPRICLSCRSATFLIYTGCQFVLIVATTFHTRYTTDKSTFETLTSYLYSLPLSTRTICVFSLFIVLCATGLSLFTAAAGTLMQIIGVYYNCLCSIPTTTWFTTRDSETFNLPSDTADDRDASKYWSACGYTATGFMAFVCYIGWWYQRYLRRRFMQRIGELAPHGVQYGGTGGGLTNGAGGVVVNETLNAYKMTTMSGRVEEEETVVTGILPDEGLSKGPESDVRRVSDPPT